MKLLLSALISFLPIRYREKFGVLHLPPGSAVLSGILEILVCVGLLIHRYFVFMNARLAALPLKAMLKAAERLGETLIMAFGNVFMVEYILQFTTLFLIFLTLEGAVRVFAALGNGEVLPSLPLQLLALLHAQLKAGGREIRLGRRIRDEVELTGGQSLRIASCRPKAWNHLVTISFNGELYEVAREVKGPAPRPFVYILKKKSLSGVVRGLHLYDPDEVLKL